LFMAAIVNLSLDQFQNDCQHAGRPPRSDVEADAHGRQLGLEVLSRYAAAVVCGHPTITLPASETQPLIRPLHQCRLAL
jgi:hypothetical protein